MRPYILAETNWYNIREISYELAILPWGATEAHNYHLPYSADIIESDLIAAEAARIAWEKGTKVVVLPTLPFGVNTGQKDIYLDINLNPSTQLAILNDIITVLNHQGLKRLLILNSHGGNDFKPLLRELGARFPEMILAVANWYQALDRKKYFDDPGDHADEMETSLLLYLKPGLVLPKEKWGEGRERKNRIQAFREGWAWTERRWPQVTDDTGIGNPQHATREKGEAFYRDLTEKLAGLLCELSVTEYGDMYK
ncbi:MAG: creatininase family protein [Bacteroidales bacterium]